MLITPVDEYNNLFQVQNLVPDSLLEQITSTNWLELPHNKISNQSTWSRRNVNGDSLSWTKEWQDNIDSLLDTIQQQTNTKLNPQPYTNWWIDEPGFTCGLHTDGELPASLQMFWTGKSNLGTIFYNYNNCYSIRKQFKFIPNTGYIMINIPTNIGYRHLQWHGMLTAVPANTIRITSYTYLNPVKYQYAV